MFGHMRPGNGVGLAKDKIGNAIEIELMRPCDIDGNLAYHLTTFFEKGGMVTLFAFEEGVHIPQGSGWWRDVYWQVRHNADGKAVVMVAQKEKAISAANRALIEAKSS